MFDDMFSLIMAAEESMLKADIGISGIDDNSYEEISAIESAVMGYSPSSGMALESIFSDSDNYGWGAALESEDSSDTEKKPNIFQQLGAMIKAAFKKLGDVFKGIGERIKTWWNNHFNKQIRTANAQRAATPATTNWKNIPHPNDPARTPSGQKVKNAATKYFDLIRECIDKHCTKPANASLNLVENLKRAFLSSAAYSTADHDDSVKKIEEVKDLIKTAESQIENVKDAKVELNEAIAPFKNAGESYKEFLGALNPNALKGNLDKITETCNKHAEFCTKFSEEYDRISGNRKRMSASAADRYSENVDFGKDGVHTMYGTGKLESDLYAIAKEYLRAGTIITNLSNEYTAACALFL